jgi:hypothetical protein
MDVRTARELEQGAYESAERTARQGAGLARSMGLPGSQLVRGVEIMAIRVVPVVPVAATAEDPHHGRVVPGTGNARFLTRR